MTFTTYDELQFSSKPSPERHPDRLCTMARMFGINAPFPATAKVLELGCASGGNLIPLALALPHAEFVGIDHSEVQVREGRQAIAELGLRNIEITVRDIMDTSAPPAAADYVICHGVFSWADERVQRKIFELCACALTENGVALVSFNSSPGWNMRGVLRQAIAYRDRKQAPREERLVEARLLLKFMSAALTDDMRPFSTLLKQELEGVSGQSDSYLFHELLEPVNRPMQFSDFAARASDAGLAYLSDARTSRTLFTRFPDIVPPRQALRGYGGAELSRVEAEQYMDLLSPVAFRSTLLCRKDRSPSMTMDPAALRSFHIGGHFNAIFPEPDLKGQDEEEFCDVRGVTFSESNPIVKLALGALTMAWPRTISFDVLYDTVQREMAGLPWTRNAQPDHLAGELLEYFKNGLIEISASPSNFTLEVPATPVAHPYARRQALTQSWVTNYRHEFVELNALERTLVPLLDGTRDRTELLKCVGAEIEAAGPGEGETQDLLESALDMLAKGALFQGCSTTDVVPTGKRPDDSIGIAASREGVRSLFSRLVRGSTKSRGEE